jgi:hypothetical protein
MAVGTACKVGVKRHHVIMKRCGSRPCYGSREHIHFIDETITLTEKRNELIGMAVTPQFKKKGNDVLFDPVDIHGVSRFSFDTLYRYFGSGSQKTLPTGRYIDRLITKKNYFLPVTLIT